MASARREAISKNPAVRQVVVKPAKRGAAKSNKAA